MKVVALISGGKDSCYNMMQCVAAGHSIAALANLWPPESATTDELDSHMYQTVGHQAVELYTEAMGLPLYRRTIRGRGLHVGRDYSRTEGDEVEDLFQLLRLVREKEPGVEAVSVGAILSDYQRTRVEHVCGRLGLVPLAYLWRRDQGDLLSEMMVSGLRAILVKVAALGLDPDEHLGKPLADVAGRLRELSDRYGVHACGEGGEYETLTLDCPLFGRRIVVDAAETVIHSADAFAPVGYLRLTRMHTEDKSRDAVATARALPPRGGRCPCQNAIDEMTRSDPEDCDEEEDHTEDDRQEESMSNCDLSCHRRGDRDELPPPSCSPRTPGGYQWISGINGLQSTTDPGIEGQTVAAFTMLRAQLDDGRGWQMKHIVLVHVYVRAMEDFGRLNAVYGKHFGAVNNPPARVCVQASLPAGQLLQLDCLLHDWPPEEEDRDGDSSPPPRRKEALHVQSVSHWAPANIGPYSQALRVDERVFCAGQIALVPCTMRLLVKGSGGGVGTQARLCFGHVEKVLDAAISGGGGGRLTLAHVLQAHVYATRRRDVPVIRAVWESRLRAAAARDEGSRGEDRHRTPLVVAVVPALPKAASVELHVIAVRDDPGERTSCRVTSTQSGCASIECRAVVSSDGRSATLSLSLSHADTTTTPTLEVSIDVVKEALVEAIGAAFNSTVERMTGSGRLSPLCARVFYKGDHSSALLIATGLEECLRSRSGGPSVALVPVLDLPDSLILHLSCWLSV